MDSIPLNYAVVPDKYWLFSHIYDERGTVPAANLSDGTLTSIGLEHSCPLQTVLQYCA